MLVPAVEDRRYAYKRQVSKTYNLPAPVGGINARDALTDMKPDDAVSLENVFCEASDVVVRGGHQSWVTGIGAPVRTLMVWHGPTDRLFATATNGLAWVIVQAYVAGASGPTVVAGLTNADMQWTNLRNAGGQYLIYVNGHDSMGAYDGTNWTVPVVTGVASTTFENVCQFKERLWFAQHDSLDLWYLPLQSIAGLAVVFPLGSVFSRGGYVTNLGTFSRDAGEGPDDYFVIISNNGEILVYEGTDPSSSTTWALAGRFDVGKPIGRRATVKLSGDLGIITQDGVVSLQALLQYGREQVQKAAITGKIQTLFSQYSQAYFSNFGWQPCVFPTSRYLIVNVPQVENTTQVQLVMNTISGAWTRFTGWNGNSFAVANNKLYFGGNDGVVYQAATDDYFDNGVAYAYNIQTSWQMLGGSTNKMFKMVRPTVLAGAGTVYNLTVDVDFLTSTVAVPDSHAGLGMIWPWTWPGFWVGTGVLDSQWQSVGSIGTWSSINLTGLANGGPARFNAFELIAEPGGPI